MTVRKPELRLQNAPVRLRWPLIGIAPHKTPHS